MSFAEKGKQVMCGNNDLFIFVHIPKTAGMTFRKILDRQFTSDQIYKVGPEFQASIDQLKVLSEEQKAQINCISGHVPYGIHQYFPLRSVHYISFVRDPVERAVSEYCYFRNRPELLPLIGIENTDSFTPQEYLLHLEKMGMGDFQTRILTGYGNMIDAVFPPYPKILEESKEELMENLHNKYAFIGTVSFFDESLLMMQQQFGWRSIRYISRNVAQVDPEKIDLQQSIGDEIRRLNPLDNMLYQSTTTRIANCINAQGAEFTKGLHNYRCMNKRYSWAWRIYNRSGLRKLRMSMMKN